MRFTPQTCHHQVQRVVRHDDPSENRTLNEPSIVNPKQTEKRDILLEKELTCWRFCTVIVSAVFQTLHCLLKVLKHRSINTFQIRFMLKCI